ncbi:MAG: hypothetical protein AAAB13_20735 [Pseudomonas sp.]
MSSVHNDLAGWAQKARLRGQKTIKIDVDTADRASEQIISQAVEIERLRNALRPFSDFAGAVFSRNFNSHDDIMELDSGDGDWIALSCGDFFEALALPRRDAGICGGGLHAMTERLEAWAKQITTEISDAIGLGSEMFVRHGDIYRIDPTFVSQYIRERRKNHHDSMHRNVRRIRELEEKLAALSPDTNVCQYAQDVGMPEHRCAVRCVYEDKGYSAAIEQAARVAELYDETETLSAPKAIAAAIRALSPDTTPQHDQEDGR